LKTLLQEISTKDDPDKHEGRSRRLLPLFKRRSQAPAFITEGEEIIEREEGRSASVAPTLTHHIHHE
jgi:hypothetical protein